VPVIKFLAELFTYVGSHLLFFLVRLVGWSI